MCLLLERSGVHFLLFSSRHPLIFGRVSHHYGADGYDPRPGPTSRRPFHIYRL